LRQIKAWRVQDWRDAAVREGGLSMPVVPSLILVVALVLALTGGPVLEATLPEGVRVLPSR
jgi:hypothetical protein